MPEIKKLPAMEKNHGFYIKRAATNKLIWVCCDCGAAIDAAEKLGRDWIGIDVTQLAISLIKNRLQDTYGSRMKFISSSSRREEAQASPPERSQSLVTSAATGDKVSLVRIIGEPTTPNEAATLAEDDKYQFQWWALGLVGA